MIFASGIPELSHNTYFPPTSISVGYCFTSAKAVFHGIFEFFQRILLGNPRVFWGRRARVSVRDRFLDEFGTFSGALFSTMFPAWI
jgi:hypothetical protein